MGVGGKLIEPEPLMTMGTGYLSKMASGYAALRTLLHTGDIDAAKKVVEDMQQQFTMMPETEGGKESLKRIEAVTKPITELAEKGVSAAGEKAMEVAGPTAGAVTETVLRSLPDILGAKTAMAPKVAPKITLPTQTKKVIRKGIEKAIRPSVAGKKTRGQIKQYHDKAATAVEEIISNKNNLDLRNELGERIEGLPQNLDQFSQAVEQTKKQVFNRYDALAKEAGDIGVNIDLSVTANKLDDIFANKVLEDISPETIDYARKRVEVLEGRGNYTATETQEAIQLYNQTLEKFYRDPSVGNKGQALVDSLIANDLRKQLDTAIEGATGKEYQSLKNKYGALKTIEKDVTHRAIVDARKNNKGLLDFTDVFTGANVVSGMLAREPVTAIAGATGKGISAYYKMLNDPNRVVKSMFKDVEKLTQSTPPRRRTPLAGTGVIIREAVQEEKEK
jgi:hypothetical protein